MDLPQLDCHAHVSVTVTERQIAALDGAVVFAMTRNPEEAFQATQRYDNTIVWGCGAHPAAVATGTEVSIEQFARRCRDFALVGEVGVDRRSGNLDVQRKVFAEILERIADEPVLVSVHSAGCQAEVIAVVRQHPHPGLIMHWFAGDQAQVAELVALGCYFSLNSAMSRTQIAAVPLDRLLPETDFPLARRKTGQRPGDMRALEQVVGEIHGLDAIDVRRQWWRNLRRISVASGAIDRMPSHVVDLMMLA